ncbi:MAG: Metalloendopeptidase-like protein membrane protein [Candidatus Uhrbacteria bacterium GW2011_GWF2_39_13]|uniref:Metalloendopeptidase-like protein membrane protein n=1 Tax=Candidatus Uhrbacteria bacterium GW2011_GWF2_39_13 TaxID=1618995 RepID=A0A0G0MLW3_9BACT|nr:MAG: Metalloendopeptidase-like protein membrane protein [Candidatus Uhrbacteria bacterium GW2011_GWF2_39_13]HAU66342.1 hypothetical protein [Candidatus Uhrbacteria bacterium]
MRYLLIALLFMGVGCSSQVSSQQGQIKGEDQIEPIEIVNVEEVKKKSLVVLPLDNNVVGYQPIYKRFGEYFQDRFTGYHTADDAEVPAEDLSPGEIQLVPVRAVADGTVVYKQTVEGYGGVIVLQHEIDGESIQTLYGHVDLDSSSLVVGDKVTRGQFLVNLGEPESEDTDGERQHLHFAVYPGTKVQLRGYVTTVDELVSWINPHDFFVKYGALETSDPTISSYTLWYPQPPRTDTGLSRISWGDLAFLLPSDWDVEYISSLDALNLYKVSGTGSARERSQLLIRYFDASSFFTLSTVTIHSQEDLLVGVGDYIARQYDIEKKPDIDDFSDQPSWRNQRHLVTDFRGQEGYTRYYVVAANPELDSEIYKDVLDSMQILQ